MKGRKTGGRTKGTPNKAKAELLERIQRKWHNYHPVLAMAALANDETQPIELRFQANKEVAQYVEPKRKAVEVTGDAMSPSSYGRSTLMGSEAPNEPLEIRYWPGPVADQAHRSKTTVKLIWGALGTAKTTWLCWRVWFMAELAAYHGFSLRAVLMRDTYRNLVDSTLQTWLSWFPEGEMGYTAASNPVDFKLFVGGRYHDVLFRHGQNAQDASAFLSTEYDFIGLEEVAPAYILGGKLTSPGIAEEVFDMALPRLPFLVCGFEWRHNLVVRKRQSLSPSRSMHAGADVLEARTIYGQFKKYLSA